MMALTVSLCHFGCLAAERHATTAHAWLAAVTSFLRSTLAAVCFWGAI